MSFKTRKPRVVVFVEGGNVQTVWASAPCEVLIIDEDNACAPGATSIDRFGYYGFGGDDGERCEPGAVGGAFARMQDAFREARARQATAIRKGTDK